MKQGPKLRREDAEALAIQALTFIAEDAERLGRFLAVTGIGPAEIRSAARERGFLGGVLDFLASDERLVMAFAGQTGVDPAAVEKGRAALSGDRWEREIP